MRIELLSVIAKYPGLAWSVPLMGCVALRSFGKTQLLISSPGHPAWGNIGKFPREGCFTQK